MARDAGVLREIAAAVEAGDDEALPALVQEALGQGMPAASVLDDGLVAGMESLGRQFGAGEVFLPEVLAAADALNAAVSVLGPHLVAEGNPARGKVVIGTVAGDVHSIGKNLVALLLRGNGYEVTDLGVDVSVEEFVAAVADERPQVLAMSALLSSTTAQFAAVTEALEIAGLRRQVRVLVGGAPVRQEFATRAGADGFAANCVAAVAEATRLMAETEDE